MYRVCVCEWPWLDQELGAGFRKLLEGIVVNIKYLLLIFGVINIVFVFDVLLNRRGYQDTWILQDIFLPTIIYILAFVFVAVKIDDNRILVFVCAAFLMTLNAIPNLKYDLFQGTFDAAAHYGFANQILSTGFVQNYGLYASTYYDFPGMHIFLSAVSLVLGVNLVTTMSLVTSVIYGPIPFLFYFVTNGVFDKKIQKYVIISSGLPATLMSYSLSGSTFGIILLVALVCVFLKRNLTNYNGKAYTVVLLLLGFGLLFTHAVSIVSLVAFLALMLILIEIFAFVMKNHSSTSFVRASLGIFAIISVSLLAWLDLKANSVFQLLVQIGQSYLVRNVIKTPAPSTFFQMPLIDELTFLVMYYASIAVFSVLMVAGLLVLVKKRPFRNSRLREQLYLPLICFLGGILIFAGFDSLTGRTEYIRFVYYALALSPLLVGLFLWFLDQHFKNVHKKTWIKSLILFAVIFSIISISLISIFPYQPMTPTANDISKSLPANEYIFDFREVNTIYQLDEVHFAEEFSPANAIIACDRVTRWQIAGFANVTFYDQTLWYSPLDTNLTSLGLKWDICLLHYDGKAGPLNEYVANRTRAAVDEFRNTAGDTVYDNGQSFIIWH
jgi:hypothetical protein